MTALGKATVRIDDAAIKARMRGLLAQAWDEGLAMAGPLAVRAFGDLNSYRDEAGA